MYKNMIYATEEDTNVCYEDLTMLKDVGSLKKGMKVESISIIYSLCGFGGEAFLCEESTFDKSKEKQ